jgi:hypothetical protein
MRQFVTRVLKATPSSFREALLRRTVAAAEEGAKFRAGQPTMWGSLQNLARIGFRPGAIIDVGANIGAWATTVASIFPGCPIHMIEAQPDLEPQLAATGFPYSISLLGREGRASVPFFLSGTGSSAMEEVTSFHKEKVELPMQALDGLGPVQSLPGPAAPQTRCARL